MVLLVITAAAVAYGVAAGLLLPRAAYRLSVEPDAAWHDRCPEGHPIRGWLGPPHCRGGGAGSARHRYGAGPAWTAGVAGVVCGVLGEPSAGGPRPWCSSPWRPHCSCSGSWIWPCSGCPTC